MAKGSAYIGGTSGGDGVSTRRRVHQVVFFANHLAISSVGGLLIVTRGLLLLEASVIRRFQ
jgi:hypothetical protein